MPLDDRDRAFEKALARQLRRDAPDEACPDAEALAAYHQRSLEPEGMMRWKHHIISCVRCQDVLANLEKTEQIPAAADPALERNEIPVFEIPWLTRDAPPAEEAPLQRMGARDPAAAAPKVLREQMTFAKAPAEIPRSRTHWRWLAPAGAIAAGLLTWVAVRETRIAPKPVEVAANRQEGANAPATSAVQPAVEGQSRAMEDSGRAVVEDKRAVNQPKLLDQTRTQAQLASKMPQESKSKNEQRIGALPEKRAASEPMLQEEATPQASPGAREFSEYKLRKEQALGAITGKRNDSFARQKSQLGTSKPQIPAGAPQKTSLPKDEPLPAQAPENLTAGKERDQLNAVVAAAPPPPAASAEENAAKKNEVSHATGVFRENLELSKDSKAKQGFAQAADVLTVRTIRAPSGQSQWIISSKGLILRSSDGGQAWRGQESGVSTALIAGSAPNDTVCWLVGAQGTILLTTDGGQHWVKLASPTTADLIGVSARDAQNAAIWSDLRLPRFVTHDGGKTWQSAATE